MSILICTPCYGGMAHVAFMKSCLDLKESLIIGNIHHDFLFTSNESLIQRARNTSVATFLKTDYQKLFFIDSDIDFTPEDVSKLWNLNTDVAVGAYSMKRPDKPVSAWKDGGLVDLSELKEITEVDYAGTGFMLIDREVFVKFKETYTHLNHIEGNVGECHCWFDPRVQNGEPGDNFYMSEDYAFCQDWRELGGKILLDPSISLGHWGAFRYA